MMLIISSLSVGWINVELLHLCFKYSEKSVREYLMFWFVVSEDQ